MRVLIVDDHSLIRSGLKETLSAKFTDIEIMEAASGQEALNLLDQQNVDLAIVDLFMPGEEAFSFVSVDGVSAT